MNLAKLLKVLAWGQIDNMEFTRNLDAKGLEEIVSDPEKLAKYKNGNPILLDGYTVDYGGWQYVENKKTLSQALADGLSNNSTNVYGLCQGIYNANQEYDMETDINLTIEDMDTYPLSGVASLKLKDIVERTVWMNYTARPVIGAGVTTPNWFPKQTYTFIEVLEQNKFQYPYYMQQFGTNRELYLEYHTETMLPEIKDATTGQPIELDASLLTGGKWYVGNQYWGSGYKPPVTEPEVPETGGESGGTPVNITNALTTINWDTQELVYKEGEATEFVVKNKEEYENRIIVQFVSPNESNITLKSILSEDSWVIRTKTQ
ncbi:hypothetical protein [Bacillus phage vB_BanS-Thrax4]|nr:hypothetical protein [Bacillus phage vB_BanS-Thrax4]